MKYLPIGSSEQTEHEVNEYKGDEDKYGIVPVSLLVSLLKIPNCLISMTI